RETSSGTRRPRLAATARSDTLWREIWASLVRHVPNKTDNPQLSSVQRPPGSPAAGHESRRWGRDGMFGRSTDNNGLPSSGQSVSNRFSDRKIPSLLLRRETALAMGSLLEKSFLTNHFPISMADSRMTSQSNCRNSSKRAETLPHLDK